MPPPPEEVGNTDVPAASSPLARLAAEHDRWLLWLPVALGCGIAFYFSLEFEPFIWSGLAVLAISAMATWMARGKTGIWIPGLVIALVAAGFTLAQWRSLAVSAPALEAEVGPTRISGRVVEVESLESGERAVIERPRIAGVSESITPERLRISLRGKQPEIAPGTWISVRAVVGPPSAPVAPGAFDFQRQAFFRGIGGVGYAIGTAEIIDRSQGFGMDAIALKLASIRHYVTTRVMEVVEGPKGAVAAALLTGERRAVPARLMEAIRDSGLAHLLAISGLHIGMVAGTVFFGLRGLLALIPFVALRHPIKKWAAAAAIVAAFCYTLLAGATIPTQRAFLMVGLVLAGVLLDRRGIGMRLVAWAALVVLVVQPESLLGASFQLSFAAVVALIAVYEEIRDRRTYGSGRPGTALRFAFWVGGIALTTIVATMATSPYALYHFNRLPTYGLAANLVAVPATGLWVMPWAVASLLLMPFGLEGFPLAAMGWGTDFIVRVAEEVASWPGSVVMLPAMSDIGIAAVTLGGLWLCIWRGNWRYWGIAGVVAGMASLSLARPPDVLVDGRARLWAVLAEDGSMAASSNRLARFERESWLRLAGNSTPVGWPDGIDGLRCDAAGCVFDVRGKRIALVREAGALIEDCWTADVLVSLVPVRLDCPRPLHVIDRFDLWRDGAHAIRVERNVSVR